MEGENKQNSSLKEEKTINPSLLPRRCTNLYSEAELSRSINEYLSDTAGELGYNKLSFYLLIKIIFLLFSLFIGSFSSLFLPYPEKKQELTYALILFFSLTGVVFIMDIFFFEETLCAVQNKQGLKLYITGSVDINNKLIIYSLRSKNHKKTADLPLKDVFDTEGYLLMDVVRPVLVRLFKEIEEEEEKDKKNN